ncbi:MULTISPECIES: MurR/RpiR family transcriptional regulator [unclassified Paludibacterium]|uniref:MurR/RpiR family transcriptional regulator n=1 Tax=unclassified Paludibacterium TaxID=2618429 RepID=UPI001C049EB3|nr:MurR/RpiR family transcriptional regulator [Paludibacterium sp. B53371]BEV71878.1 MurR/RpiR family transcriptional regulator [Paludibacterium sp. THUN1379]
MPTPRPATAIYQTPVIQRLATIAPTLPPALSRVADFILRNPLKAATMTIDEVARETATSAAAVNRLANAADLGGFSGLKAALLETLQAFVSPVEKLRQQIGADQQSPLGLTALLQTARDGLRQTAGLNDQQAFDAAVDCLLQARKVYVLGFGNSVYLAGYAAANLVPYCADAQVISMEGGNENAAYRLATIAEQDVLLAISLPRYSLDTDRLARFAAKRGARIVAITDSPAAPLQSVAHHVLYAATEHPVLINANLAAFGLIEALISGVMLRNQDAAALSAEMANSVLPYLYV